MKKVSSTLAVAVLAALAALCLPAAALAADGTKVIHVQNQTDWEIHHLFLAHAGKEKWGPDLLAGQIIAVGGSFELRKVACGTWDVKLVDEDGDECIMGDIDLCAAKEGWVITNDALLECESASGDQGR
jgi:hypothetical protein